MANDRGLQEWEAQPAHGTDMDDLDLERIKSYLQLRSTRGN
ncbi:hypothetical protein [Tengunoibacter tsumagoiensis]|nr:hypothetical protein [Tengunoibacter tsumagoiensis]